MASVNGVIFPNLIAPFLKLLQTSSTIATLVSASDAIVNCTIDRLKMIKAYDSRVRVNLMRMLMSLYENHPNQPEMVEAHSLHSVVQELENDHLLIIIELASKLKTSINSISQ